MVNIIGRRKRRSDRRPLVFRIWYGDEIVYVWYTSKYLTTALRNVFFGVHQRVDVTKVTKVDYQGKRSLADAAVYAMYYKHLFNPTLQYVSPGPLTIHLKQYKWTEFTSPVFARWVRQRQHLNQLRAKHKEQKRADFIAYIKKTRDSG